MLKLIQSQQNILRAHGLMQGQATGEWTPECARAMRAFTAMPAAAPAHSRDTYFKPTDLLPASWELRHVDGDYVFIDTAKRTKSAVAEQPTATAPVAPSVPVEDTEDTKRDIDDVLSGVLSDEPPVVEQSGDSVTEDQTGEQSGEQPGEDTSREQTTEQPGSESVRDASRNGRQVRR